MFKLFRKKKTKTLVGEGNSKFEIVLEKKYGLTHISKGKEYTWTYNGYYRDEFKNELRDSKTCWDLLNAIKKQSTFNEFCIVIGGGNVLFICDTKPQSIGFTTSLSTDKIASFVAYVISKNAKQIKSYNGVYLFEL